MCEKNYALVAWSATDEVLGIYVPDEMEFQWFATNPTQIKNSPFVPTVTVQGHDKRGEALLMTREELEEAHNRIRAAPARYMGWYTGVRVQEIAVISRTEMCHSDFTSNGPNQQTLSDDFIESICQTFFDEENTMNQQYALNQMTGMGQQFGGMNHSLTQFGQLGQMPAPDYHNMPSSVGSSMKTLHEAKHAIIGVRQKAGSVKPQAGIWCPQRQEFMWTDVVHTTPIVNTEEIVNRIFFEGKELAPEELLIKAEVVNREFQVIDAKDHGPIPFVVFVINYVTGWPSLVRQFPTAAYPTMLTQDSVQVVMQLWFPEFCVPHMIPYIHAAREEAKRQAKRRHYAVCMGVRKEDGVAEYAVAQSKDLTFTFVPRPDMTLKEFQLTNEDCGALKAAFENNEWVDQNYSYFVIIMVEHGTLQQSGMIVGKGDGAPLSQLNCIDIGATLKHIIPAFEFPSDDWSYNPKATRRLARVYRNNETGELSISCGMNGYKTIFDLVAVVKLVPSYVAATNQEIADFYGAEVQAEAGEGFTAFLVDIDKGAPVYGPVPMIAKEELIKMMDTIKRMCAFILPRDTSASKPEVVEEATVTQEPVAEVAEKQAYTSLTGLIEDGKTTFEIYPDREKPVVVTSASVKMSYEKHSPLCVVTGFGRNGVDTYMALLLNRRSHDVFAVAKDGILLANDAPLEELARIARQYNPGHLPPLEFADKWMTDHKYLIGVERMKGMPEEDYIVVLMGVNSGNIQAIITHEAQALVDFAGWRIIWDLRFSVMEQQRPGDQGEVGDKIPVSIQLETPQQVLDRLRRASGLTADDCLAALAKHLNDPTKIGEDYKLSEMSAKLYLGSCVVEGYLCDPEEIAKLEAATKASGWDLKWSSDKKADVYKTYLNLNAIGDLK